jgi:SAM-dependent methyltransferase
MPASSARSSTPSRNPPSPVYGDPAAYDLAFSFRDPEREVAFLCAALRRFSGRAPRKVLELACGSAPHLPAWRARGCAYVGLDRSGAMLRAARARGLPAELVRGDMRRFAPGSLRVDVAYVMLGSLYLRSNAELLAQLHGLERALRPGGLYVLDGVACFHPLGDGRQEWTVRRGAIRVTARYQPELVDALSQTFRQVLRLEVEEDGRRRILESSPVTKLHFPQELELLVRHQGGFEVMGWFDDFDLRRRARAGGRPVLVLRRRRGAAHAR